MATRGDGDDFGDRMKGYEAAETSRVLDREQPVYARIDGRAFSGFTRSMDKPFDPKFSAVMIATTRHLVESTGASVGYVQSDEISLAWLPSGAEVEPPFGGKIHKLTSVLASLAAAGFQFELRRAFDVAMSEKLSGMLPHFDARVFALPNKIEAANAFLWRALDARKNAVSMATRSICSAKSMHGADQAKMLRMLRDKGIDFDSYPAAFKWGTWLRRVKFERSLTDAERLAIPERHRPAAGAVSNRSEVRVIAMPEFSTVVNKVEVIFDGADAIQVAPKDLSGV